MKKSPFTFSQRALLYAGGWLPVAVFYTFGMRQTAAPDLPTAVFWTAGYLVPAMLTGALIWRVASRLHWREMGWPRFMAMELVNAIWFVAQWHLLFYLYFAVADSGQAARSLASQVLIWQLLMAMLVAGMHAAVFHAVRALSELREQELAAAAAETARIRAEMLALRGQLDPHFLFNSLHSITALVREDPHRAEDALLQFAALLRRVLAVKRDSTDEVALADEMKFVDDYLAIERLRLGDRLRLTREISPEAHACRLPAFSVQPLVENALRHAIAPRRDGGQVIIRAAVRDGRLDILVHDDGPGANPELIAHATGVGLSVIRQRLQLRHGAHATLVVDTAPGKGFSATLSLPAESDSVAGQLSDLTMNGSATRPTLA